MPVVSVSAGHCCGKPLEEYQTALLKEGSRLLEKLKVQALSVQLLSDLCVGLLARTTVSAFSLPGRRIRTKGSIVSDMRVSSKRNGTKKPGNALQLLFSAPLAFR